MLNSVILLSITSSAWAPRSLSAAPGTRINCNCTLIPLTEADVVPTPSFFVVPPLCWEPYGSILWMDFMPLKVSQAVWRGCLLSHSGSIWKHWHLVTVWSEMNRKELESWQGVHASSRTGDFKEPFTFIAIFHMPSAPQLIWRRCCCQCEQVHMAIDGVQALSFCPPCCSFTLLPFQQRFNSQNLVTVSVAPTTILSCILQPLLFPTDPFPAGMTLRSLWAHPALPQTWVPAGAVQVTDPCPNAAWGMAAAYINKAFCVSENWV